MFRELMEFIWGIIRSRVFILLLILSLLFSGIVVRLFNLQIINNESYLDNYVQKMEKEILIDSTRGNIYDKNGVLLAYNELTYSVQITDTIESSQTKNNTMNEILHKTINLIEKNGDSLIYDFPLVLNELNDPVYDPNLSERSRLRFLKNIYGTEILDTEEKRLSGTTAVEAFEVLVDKYDLDTAVYGADEVMKILNIRYNLSLNAYQKYISTTIATEVSMETVAAIYEEEANIPGVIIAEDTVRKYNEALYFAHIIGYTGKISEDELVSFNQQGGNYTSNDTVGKTGIEASYELILAGQKGEQKVLVDNMGRVLSVVEAVDAVAGSDVYLTLDVNLQKGIYYQIEQKLAGLLLGYIVDGELTQKQEENLYIPAKRVYFQLFNNNVVDIDKFSIESASDNEKAIYAKFKKQFDKIIDNIKIDLNNPNSKPLNNLSDQWKEYYNYIFNKLYADTYGLNIIVKERINKEDEVYKKFINDETSFRTFLLHAIAQNWIDLSKIEIGDKYADSETIYNALTDYIINTIAGDKAFDKLIYKELIYNKTIKANEVLRTLYDQGVLEMNDNEYYKLRNNSYSFTFIKEQIRTISITPAQLALEPCSGSVVITNPYNGDVLAMVSYPSYDNNAFSGSIDYDTWTVLNEDLSRPMYNRATKTRTAPGSTFKLLTSMTVLSTGIATRNTTIYTTGIYENELITTTPKCWVYPGMHGNVNVERAIEVSCNYFFYEMGIRLGSYQNGSFSHDNGLAILKKYASMFGLTQKSGVEIEEYSPLFSTTDIITSAIGQGSHSYTNTQISRYAMTIANEGYNYELTLIDKVVDTNNVVTKNEDPVVERIEISDGIYDIIKSGMYRVVTKNIASIFKNVEFTLGGKTGTAQENLKLPSHSVFVAFAPFDKPVVSISTVVQNGYVSATAAEITRNVLRYYFGYIDLEDILNCEAEKLGVQVQPQTTTN